MSAKLKPSLLAHHSKLSATKIQVLVRGLRRIGTIVMKKIRFEKMRKFGLALLFSGGFYVLVSAISTPLFVILALILGAEIIFSLEKSYERMIFFIALSFGAVPIIGWFPLARFVNPFYLIFGFWSVSLIEELGSGSHPRLSLWIQRLKPNLMAIVAPIVSFLLFSPIAQGGDEKVLARLLQYWDHGSHFYFYFSSLTNGSYISTLQPPAFGEKWQGREYPAGTHLILAKLTESVISQNESVSNQIITLYANSIILLHTFALWFSILMIIRLLFTNAKRFLFTIPISACMFGMYTLGLGSQTVFFGFANYPSIWIGLSLGISILIKPLENRLAQILCAVGTIGILSYNWWPAACVIFPPLLLQTLKLVEKRKYSAIVISAFLLQLTFPILITLSLGVNHLNIPGGIAGLSLRSFLIFCVLLPLVAIVILSQFDKKSPHLLHLSYFILLSLFCFGIAVNNVITNLYYITKFLQILYFYAFIFLLQISAHFFSEYTREIEKPRRSKFARDSSRSSHSQLTQSREKILSWLLAILILASGANWGLLSNDFKREIPSGLERINEFGAKADQNSPLAGKVILAVQESKLFPIQRLSNTVLIFPNQLASNANSNSNDIQILGNIWFHSLTNSQTESSWLNSYKLSGGNIQLDGSKNVCQSVIATFEKAITHIITSEEVASCLKQSDPGWSVQVLR